MKNNIFAENLKKRVQTRAHSDSGKAVGGVHPYIKWQTFTVLSCVSARVDVAGFDVPAGPALGDSAPPGSVHS